jgi:hypothetical protein
MAATLACLALALAAGCGSDTRSQSASTPAGAASSAAASTATPEAEHGPKLATCAGASCFATKHGFRPIHPTPILRTLEAVYAVRRGEAIAVGDDGTVVRLFPDLIERIDVPNLPSAKEILVEIDRSFDDEELYANDVFTQPRLEGVFGAGGDLFVLIHGKRIARFDGSEWSMERPPAGIFDLDFGEEMIAGPEGGPVVLPSAMDTVFKTVGVFVRDGGVWRRGPKLPKKEHARSGVSTDKDIWLGGRDGQIFVSRSGQDFVLDTALPDKSDVVALWLDRKGQEGVAATRNTRIYERVKGGWKPQDEKVRGKPSGDVEAFWHAPDGFLWAIGEKIDRRAPHGPWTEVSLPEWVRSEPFEILEGERFHAIAGTAADDVWMVGRRGVVMHWDGHLLKEVTKRFTEHDPVALVRDGAEGWLAFFRDGAVLHGDGRTVELETVFERSVYAAFRADDGSVIVQTADSPMKVRTAGGWRPGPELKHGIAAAAGPTATDFYAVSTEGRAWRVLADKVTPITTGVTKDLRAIAIAGPRDVWMAGDDVILRGDGKAFRTIATLDAETIRAIAVRSPDDVWLAGDMREIGASGLVLHWDGSKLERFEHVTTRGLRAVVTDQRNVWVAGRDGDAARFDGKTWIHFDTGSPGIDALVLTKSGVLVGAGDGGTIVSGPSAFDR